MQNCYALPCPPTVHEGSGRGGIRALVLQAALGLTNLPHKMGVPAGPYQPGDPLFGTDDNFGGPEPGDAHLTGSIFRLNDDGSTPADNPFTEIGHVFVARLEGTQEVPPNTSTAKGYAAFFLNQDGTALRFIVTVTGLDFTGTQTADPSDD